MGSTFLPRVGVTVPAPDRDIILSPDRKPLVRRPMRLAFTLLAAVAAGLLAFALFAHETYQVGPGQVYVAASPSLRGTTTLDLPPFGSVSADTHAAPVAVTASLKEVDLVELQSMAAAGYPSQKTLEAFKDEVRRGAQRAVGKGLIAALLAATFVGWSLRRSPRGTLAAGLIGLVIPASLLGWTARGYDLTAFKEPTYRGALRYAPSLIELAQSRVSAVGDLQKQLGETVREFSTYYAQPQSFTAGGAMPDTVRVLAVSDLHVDPIGFKLESRLADEFHVSAILDAGDLSNFATPVEVSILRNYLDTRYPRILVPGNHESPSVVKTVGAMRNVTVLDDTTTTVDGITFYGLADPMSRQDGWEPDKKAVDEESKAAAEKMRSAEASGAKRPDIITVHDPRGGKAFAGLAPLIVSGHTHTPDLDRWSKSWYVNGGTVGGVNFSRLAPDPHIAHGATILYYTKSLPRRLIAIDQVSIFGKADQSSLKRTVVDAKLLEELKAADKQLTKAGAAAAPVPAKTR